MKPKKYRKKPVVVEVMQMPKSPTPGQAMEVYRWIESNTMGSFEPMSRIENKVDWPESGVSIDPRDGRIIISTLEGPHWVNLGDWVIRGVHGEFYPCKPEIFDKTYEKA